LLDRLCDPQDQAAWGEFVDLYGPLLFTFARRRVPQDADAADIMQEVLRAVLGGTYQRPHGRFQKWLVTILLNKIRNFHAARLRRCEVSGGTAVQERLEEEPSRSDEEEWNRDREQHLFHVAAERVQARTNPVHWDVFVRAALQNRSGADVARSLNVSVANVYAIKSRIMKEIKDVIQQFGED
jgi:RNA polymerase sigma-70 factor (ECF subfamily)